jgi:CheY-like chemotaxis protein
MRSHGFAIWLAANGVAAVDLYRRYRDAIDVVLLDVRMPVRDGPETLAAPRELDPHVCFSFMSGDTGKYTEENLIALGASAVFTKPLRLSELAQKLMAIAPRPTGCQEAFEESRWEDDGGCGKVLSQNLSESEKKLQPKTELQEV